MRHFVIALAVCALITPTARAQSWDPAPLANYCTAESAFGVRLGDQIAPGSVTYEMTPQLRYSNIDADAYAPFILVQQFSRAPDERIVAVVATASAERGLQSYRQLPSRFRQFVEALRATGRFATIHDSQVTGRYPVVRFFEHGPQDRRGLVVVLRADLASMEMHCADAALYPQILTLGTE